MKKGKRFVGKETNNTLILVVALIISIIFLVMLAVFIWKDFERKERNAVLSVEFLNEESFKVEAVLEQTKKEEEEAMKIVDSLKVIEVDMPEKMSEYNILGQLKIEEINLDLYVLDETDDKSLNLSITKFWGPEMNEIGNFSIIGHNYKRLFKNLKNLSKGDTFELIDRNGRYCKYEIFDIYKVNPDEVDCLDPSIEGIREVTLITCTPGGKQRLILKGKEIKEEI